VARSRRFRWFLSAAALIAIVLLTRSYWLAALGRYLVQSENPAPADLIVVPAGDYFGNRILTAAELVRRGLAPRALVSGPSGVYGQFECDLAIAFAARHGYPESYFLPFPNESRSTASEAEAVISQLRKLHAHRIEIVTSNYHTRRARSVYRSLAQDLEIRVVAAPDQYFSPDGWWKSREGRKIFLVEWEKTFATWVGL
jgi:uncharacterized SAM-binding protein YcdF (DUF218 family)